MPLGKLLGIPENTRTYEDAPELALRKCLTGVEFECENVKTNLPLEVPEAGFWKTDKDNSLRGNGMEFVLREPLFGQDLLASIKWFCEWAVRMRFESNYRTGLHVHIDVRNLEAPQFITMLIYYALFEKVIFKWVGNEREESIFCMPFYKADGCLEVITQALKATSKMKEYAARVDRYGAFNLNALSKYGSVEWRHLQTTFDYERLLKWVNIAQSFKKYSKAHPLNPKELLAELSKLGAERILIGIVGPHIAKDLWYDAAEKDVLSVGLPVAQDISTLLETDLNIKWDTVRTALKAGTNPSFVRWAEGVKKSKLVDELPENLFEDPALLKDPQLLARATSDLEKQIRLALDKADY